MYAKNLTKMYRDIFSDALEKKINEIKTMIQATSHESKDILNYLLFQCKSTFEDAHYFARKLIELMKTNHALDNPYISKVPFTISDLLNYPFIR